MRIVTLATYWVFWFLFKKKLKLVNDCSYVCWPCAHVCICTHLCAHSCIHTHMSVLYVFVCFICGAKHNHLYNVAWVFVFTVLMLTYVCICTYLCIHSCIYDTHTPIYIPFNDGNVEPCGLSLYQHIVFSDFYLKKN